MRIRKPAIFWLSGFTVILAACSGARQTEPTPAATSEPVTTATTETTTTVASTTSVPSCEEPPVAGTTPQARGYAAMVTLGAEGGVLLTGGETAPPPLGGEVLTDTWTFSEESGWTSLTRCPSPPWGTTAFDAESRRVILLGGVVEGWSEVRELWVFDPSTDEWSRTELNEGPDGFGFMAHDTESDRTIVFDVGGHTWAYEHNTNTWTEMNPAAAPPARGDFAMAYDSESDRLILFGGYGNGELGDTWAYDYNTNSWTEMTPPVSPSPRDYHAMTYVPTIDRLILYGGGDNVGQDDTWAYDYNTNTWTDMTPDFSPGIRSWHSMAYDAESEQVVFFSGAPRRDPNYHNDTWLYDPVANTWSPLGGIVIGGVTLSNAGCEYAGPSEMPLGDLTLRLSNKTTGVFEVDVWRLDAGHGYDELAAHIEEERRRGEEGEQPLGHPAFANLVGEASAEPAAIIDLTTSPEPGTYGLACVLVEEGQYSGIWASGPITVTD